MGKSFPFANDDPAGRREYAVDPIFLGLVLILLVFGLAVLYSASSAQSMFDTNYTSATRYLGRQAFCGALGLGCMAAFSHVPAAVLRRLTWWIYGGAIGLLLLVLAAGTSVNGAQRWISLGGIRFQPSELAKFAMILMIARRSCSKSFRPERFREGVLSLGIPLLGILIPLALEKHLSAILLMGLVAVIMMIIAGIESRWIVFGAAGAGVFAAVYIALMGYAGDRVTAWLHPELDPGDTGYQILQSLYAIGSGGMFGLGFGKSRQKYLYLPFQYNDYIFAIVCEELGIVGAGLLMGLFACLILRGYQIARNASDRFSSMTAAGLTTLIAVQTILNLCVVTNLLPSTGIALPFFSYGGTALVVNLGEMGVILSISRQWKQARKQEDDQ